MSHKSVAVLTSPPKVAVALGRANEPTEQEIAIRAYELYEKRGCETGLELEDWQQAERELKAKKKN